MPTSDLSQERKGLVASSYHILQDSCGLWNSLFCSLSFPSSFCAPVGDNSCLLYSSVGLILEVTGNDDSRTKETSQVLNIHTVRKVCVTQMVRRNTVTRKLYFQIWHLHSTW